MNVGVEGGRLTRMSMAYLTWPQNLVGVQGGQAWTLVGDLGIW